MTFQIVDIPEHNQTPISPIVEALKQNIGKAVSIPCGTRDANSVRKGLRASLSNRGVLDKYNFRTRIDMIGNALVAWLEPKETPTEETK